MRANAFLLGDKWDQPGLRERETSGRRGKLEQMCESAITSGHYFVH